MSAGGAPRGDRVRTEAFSARADLIIGEPLGRRHVQLPKQPSDRHGMRSFRQEYLLSSFVPFDGTLLCAGIRAHHPDTDAQAKAARELRAAFGYYLADRA